MIDIAKREYKKPNIAEVKLAAEEAVLQACKVHVSYIGTGPGGYNPVFPEQPGCYRLIPVEGECYTIGS
jgi:hypothetical protein